jgi:outer membrane protein TolC
MHSRLWRISVISLSALLTLAIPARGAAVGEDTLAPARSLPAAPALTLAEAVDLALRQNPAIRRAGAGQEAAGARLREARAGWLPRLDVSERFVNGNNPVFVFGTLLEQGRFTASNFALDALNAPDPVTNFRTSLDATVAIFDQFRTRTRTEQARLDVEGASAEREATEQRLRFEVLRAYFGVLVAEASKGVVDEAVRSAEADKTRLADMFETGLVVASEVLAVEVQLAEYRQQQIQAAGDVAVAYATLYTTLGIPEEPAARLTSALPENAFEMPELAELAGEALSRRPDYRQRQFELRAREEGVRGARGEYLPRVDAFASLGNSGDKFVNGSGDYTVGVSLTVGLFDAGRAARVDQARAAREFADAELQAMRDAIRLEVVRAYQDFVAARARLEVAAKAIAQADETLRIVRDRHGAGLTTITEVLRAQTALVRARMNLVATRYQHAIGYGQVLVATGKLTSVSAFEQ